MPDDVLRAFEQIAYVAGQLQAVRDAGFTADALNYPRSKAGYIALCAWNGAEPDTAPAGWKYAPNKGTLLAWERVVEALDEYLKS